MEEYKESNKKVQHIGGHPKNTPVTSRKCDI